MRPRSLDEFLKTAHIPFTTFRHAAAFSAQKEAALSHVPGRSWAKTVICFADDEPVAAEADQLERLEPDLVDGLTYCPLKLYAKLSKYLCHLSNVLNTNARWLLRAPTSGRRLLLLRGPRDER